jgi:hypothetical protein
MSTSSEKSVRIINYSNDTVVMRKQLGIDHISAVIKSKAHGSSEFLLHSPDKFDLRIQCDRRDAFLDLLKLRFAHMKPEVTLKIYGVP